MVASKIFVPNHVSKSEPENPSPSDKYTDPLPIVASGLAPLPKVNPKS